MIYIFGLILFTVLLLPVLACIENVEYEGYHFTYERVTDGIKMLGKIILMLVITCIGIYLLINSVEYIAGVLT